MTQITGGCLCGAVTIAATGEPDRVAICHCMDCRKHHGAVFYAAAIFAKSAVAVTGETHSWAGRHFCPTCGSSIFAETESEMEVHLGTLDASDQFRPTYESWVIRRETWIPALHLKGHYLRNRPTEDQQPVA